MTELEQIAKAAMEQYEKNEAERGTHSIGEIQEAKSNLEGEIQRGITRFETKYGVRIESITCKKVDAWAFENGKQIEEILLKISL
jgi:phage host-nuclease inhibitor protein Gam